MFDAPFTCRSAVLANEIPPVVRGGSRQIDSSSNASGFPFAKTAHSPPGMGLLAASWLILADIKASIRQTSSSVQGELDRLGDIVSDRDGIGSTAGALIVAASGAMRTCPPTGPEAMP